MENQEQSMTPAASQSPARTSDPNLMIDVQGLNKFFGDRHVLVNIDFPVKRGECVAVIGPSGSGKSTLIRCINYLETPTSGHIRHRRKTHVHRLSAAALSQVRRELGMVFYNFNLFPHKSVLDNITLAPIRVRKIDKAEAEKTAQLSWPKWAWARRPTRIPTSSPAARSSASPSPGRWR